MVFTIASISQVWRILISSVIVATVKPPWSQSSRCQYRTIKLLILHSILRWKINCKKPSPFASAVSRWLLRFKTMTNLTTNDSNWQILPKNRGAKTSSRPRSEGNWVSLPGMLSYGMEVLVNYKRKFFNMGLLMKSWSILKKEMVIMVRRKVYKIFYCVKYKTFTYGQNDKIKKSWSW